MAENTLDVRLLHAAKTLADWNNVTTIPKLGEVCLEIQGNTPPLNYKIKIGDGSSTYAALPYFGTVVNTSGNVSVVVVDTITDGSVTKKVLKFYKFTLTTSTVNGVTTITPTIGDLILTVQEGDGINFSTNTTDTLVNVELEATTADTAQTIADGGTFTTITKDSNNRATKYTTFTLPSIANSINALDVADNTVITAEWDSTNKQIKFYYVKETDGIIQKGSLAYTINATDIAPLQNITTTDTGNSGLEITTNNNVKDVHHKAVTQNVIDNSSVIGEKELDIITNVGVDSYGHITGYTKDKSTNLVAADIKAPVKQTDNSMWNHRVTGGTINIGEEIAKINKLRGNTIVWNQLVDTSTSSVTLVSQHKYYTVVGEIKSIQTGADSAISVTGGTDMVVDLTKIFGEGNEPATVEEFEAMFPNSYYSYNEGELLSLKPDGVKSVGFNQWDEEWIEGYLDSSGNILYGNNHALTKNAIRVFPNTTYYWHESEHFVIGYIVGYSNAGDYIGVFHQTKSVETNFTTPTNCYYIRIQYNSSYSTIDQKHFTLNLSDSSRNGTYEPYKESTLDLSWVKSIKDNDGNQLFPYGLLSAGSVYDEVGDNYAVKRVGVVDLGTLTWDREAVTYTVALFRATLSDSKASVGVQKANAVTIKYPTIKNSEFAVKNPGIGIQQGYLYTPKYVLIRDDSHSTVPTESDNWLDGVLLYYELEEPVTVYFDKKPMTYSVDDLGTETLLPKGVDSTTGVPLSAPFNGTFEYKSNFKDTVLDLIDRVNNTRNPVKGITNTNQTVDKLAIYDSVETVKSSNYSPSNATIVENAADNDIILPSVETIVNYVNSKLSSALTYKGIFIGLNNPNTSSATFDGYIDDVIDNATPHILVPSTGDMYIVGTSFTVSDNAGIPYGNVQNGTYQAGDFFIWNGTSWDIVSGTTSVIDKNPTLTPNGNTYKVGTVDGRPLRVTTPNLTYSSPSRDGQSIEFIDTVSQTDGLIAATKKTIPTATTGVNGVDYDILVPPSTSLWSPIYAPTTVGMDGQILKSNGIGAPTWTALSLSDLSLYSKKLSYKLNSSTATELGTIIRDADSDLTLPEFYAPTTAGNQYNLLMSNGSGAPSWLNFGNSEGYLKKTSSGWSLIGDSNLFFPNEDVWFYQNLPQGVSALDIAVGAQPSGIELNFYGGDGITLKKVVNASQHVLGVQINASPIVNTLQTLSSNSDTGYLRKTAADTWELDPYGGGAKESVMNDGSVITASSSATAGLRKQTGTSTYEYQKISFAAITNDTATGNNAVTIILNGNFN